MPDQTIKERCPLCGGSAKDFYRDEFYICVVCSGIFRPARLRPGPAEEKARYEKHRNDINDAGYRLFLSPVSDAVLNEYSAGDCGLDFGAGPNPVLSEILTDKGYSVKPYDPFFHADPEPLRHTYDYVICCEVIEHFQNPGKEFRLLKKLLKPGGRLYCMTCVYNQGIDFEKWPYKNDFTHVFIYQETSLEWIRNNIGFSSVAIEERLIRFFE